MRGKSGMSKYEAKWILVSGKCLNAGRRGGWTCRGNISLFLYPRHFCANGVNKRKKILKMIGRLGIPLSKKRSRSTTEGRTADVKREGQTQKRKRSFTSSIRAGMRR